MGQILLPEKIGSLSQNGGVVTLGPSIINIGGQQYRTSTLSLTLPTLTANQLYMIYAVLVGGVVTLVQDTAVNSAGPTGYTTWRLVSAYYANNAATVGFGGFVNITGAPRSDTIIHSLPTFSFVTGGWTNVNLKNKYYRDGGYIHYSGNSTFTSGTAAFNVPMIVLPGVTIDLTRFTNSFQSANQDDIMLDESFANEYAYGQTDYDLKGCFFNGNLDRVRIGSPLGDTTPGTIAANWIISYGFRLPILGWSNTQLLDL